MKYFIIPFIALGLTLSLIFGVEYTFQGHEMVSEYYGSPIVFKQQSLGSSMEYYYSISGVLLNIAIWSVLIIIIRLGINKLIEITSNSKIIIIIYKALICFLLLFSILNILITYGGIGRGFNQNLNYWYWNINQVERDWGNEFKGEWKFFIK